MADITTRRVAFGSSTRSGERHNVTVVRLYKNGETWKESGHFSRDDLLLVGKVMDLSEEQVRRVWDDLDRKLRTTEYLRLMPLHWDD